MTCYFCKIICCFRTGSRPKKAALSACEPQTSDLRPETVSLLQELVTVLSQLGLILNANKTVVLANEAQPPQHLQFPFGEGIAILEHNSGQKLISCMLTVCLAPARVKVKHYDYDPIGTCGKRRPRGPQNVKQRIAEHFAKRAVWPPRAICYAMEKIDL